MLENVVEKLIASEIGQDLGEDVCRSLVQCGAERTWKRDSMLFQEGDPARGFYLLVNGKVKMVRYTSEGREIILHPVDPYRFFAEAAPFLGTFPASAVALEEVVTLYYSIETIQELMANHRKFMFTIFDTMSTWLKRMVDKVDQLTLNDATARVTRFLINEHSTQDKNTDLTGFAVIELSMKKGDLATMLNMNQATLSRSFRKLQDERIIKVESRRIEVNDMQRLQRFALPPLE